MGAWHRKKNNNRDKHGKSEKRNGQLASSIDVSAARLCIRRVDTSFAGIRMARGMYIRVVVHQTRVTHVEMCTETLEG